MASIGLTPSDRRRYKTLKERIANSLWDAVDAANEIQEKKLFIEEYKSFDEFIKVELGYTRGRFYQLIDANKGRQRLIESVESKPSAPNVVGAQSEFETGKTEKLKIENVSVKAATELGRADEKDVQKIIDKAVEIAVETDSPLTASIVKQASQAVASSSDDGEYEDVTDDEPAKVKKEPTFSELKSVAIQHTEAIARAVDRMKNFKPNKKKHELLLEYFQDIRKELNDWK